MHIIFYAYLALCLGLFVPCFWPDLARICDLIWPVILALSGLCFWPDLARFFFGVSSVYIGAPKGGLSENGHARAMGYTTDCMTLICTTFYKS